VTAAAVTMTRFRSNQSMSSLVAGEGVEGDPGIPLSVALRRISPGYLATTRARLVAGREFTEADGPLAPKVAMISESMARRYWPGRDAIGRRFKRPPASPDWTTVVGVVGDTRDSGPGFDLGPMVLVPYAQNSAVGVSFAPVTVMVRTSAPLSDAAGLIRRTVATLDADLALETPLPVEEHLAGALAPQRFQAMLIGAFGVTALFLVGAGLYGVTAYGVSQRRREIGIRLALGAVRSRVVGLIVRQSMVPVALGTVLGLLASGWVTEAASRLLPKPGGSFLPVILVVAGFLAVVGTLSTLVPAVSAARVDPVTTLKEENA
jgi:putative ABC transport system permease protein